MTNPYLYPHKIRIIKTVGFQLKNEVAILFHSARNPCRQCYGLEKNLVLSKTSFQFNNVPNLGVYLSQI